MSGHTRVTRATAYGGVPDGLNCSSIQCGLNTYHLHTQGLQRVPFISRWVFLTLHGSKNRLFRSELDPSGLTIKYEFECGVWRKFHTNLKKSPEETFSDVSYRHFGPRSAAGV